MATVTRKLSVLIVDDDPMYRLVLSRILQDTPSVHTVKALASLEAAQRYLQEHPVDFMTLDVVLNGESGLDLLPFMKAHKPHVVMALVTAGGQREARCGVDALLLGVHALVLKPTGAGAQAALEASLRALVSQAFSDEVGLEAVTATAYKKPIPEPRDVVALGASTGGPAVLCHFLRMLPETFTLPLLIVQHMPAPHVPYFAEMLQHATTRPVHIVDRPYPLAPHGCYLASGGTHMGIARMDQALVARPIPGPEENHCRPAVDPLFRSVAQHCGRRSIGIIMTGMGVDGRDGSVAMHRAGAPVLIQDRASSVIWGMPGAVAMAHAAAEAVPGFALAEAMLRWVQIG